MNVGELHTYNDWRKLGFQVQKGQQMIGIDPDSGLAVFGEYQVKPIMTQKQRERQYWEEMESFCSTDIFDPLEHEFYH